MASFTEQATLRVVDKSSAQLRKINAELKKLFATAKSLKSISVNIKVNASGVTKATAAVRQLVAATRALRSSSVNLRANVAGIAAAQRQIAQLRAQAQRPIIIRTQHAGGGGGPAGPGGPGRPGPHYGGGGYGRTPGRAFLGGFGGGLGIGIGRLNENFGLVAVAAYGAAKALRAVADAANARDRAELAVETQTSAAQRAVFDAADKAAKDSGMYKGALRYKRDQFNLARASFLGDVGVDEGVDPKSRQGELQRAERADLLARELFKNVVPGMYARNPKLTQQESQEELKKFVQTLGITTQNMFERNAQGQLELSKDFRRVSEGLRIAQIAAPDLTMGQIRTAGAAIKSLGYTATPEQIAEILFNISSKGQRAGNEAYQMYKAGLGVTDVGKLNTAIENLGLFLPGTAKRGPKTKKHPAGLVQAGTGIPVEFTDKETGEPIKLGERPSDWWRAALDTPEVQAKIKEQMVDQAVRGLPKGATAAQKKAAADKARATEPDATVKADFVNRILAGARGTALQGILDAILGGPVAKAGIAQALVAPGPDEVNRRMEERWSVQASNFGTAVADAAGDLGALAAAAIGLSGIFKGMTAYVDQNPLTSGAIAIALGVAAGAAFLVPAGMLTNAATALIGAARVLGGGAAAGAGGVVRGAGGVLSRMVGGVAVALTAAEIVHYLATRTEAEAKRDEEVVQAQKDLLQKQAAATRIEQEQRVQEGTPQSTAQRAYMADQAIKLEGIKAEIARLQAILNPKPVVDAVENTATPSTIQAAVTRAVSEHLAKTPATATETAAAAPANVTALQALIPQLSESSNSIKLAVSDLPAAGTTFATVFSTGATAIGNSGQTAASALLNAAPGIGATIGTTAANAIRAAAADININATVTQKPAAPTGVSAP